MKIKFINYILLFSFLPFMVVAQEFDESFLKSLPPEIAQDLKNQQAQKDKAEEIQYRRPSTFIDKPAITADRYGFKVFSKMQSTLMPINEPNSDSSYILDFGDTLQLQLVGQKSSITSIPIKRDGSINIPEVGKLFLSGLSLDKAVDLIKSKIRTSFIGVEAYVTLINIRDIQIIVAGNVFNPGPYTLNGNANIFHALSISGGPSSDGSFRSIDLIRDNEVIESIDLYDTFIYAKSSFKTRLRSGDLIFINPSQNIVTISGAIKRPGSYELLQNEPLSKIIEFSNGINSRADKNSISLERILEGEITLLPIKTLQSLETIMSKDNDKLFLREYLFRSVEIKGAVKTPGKYLMNEGDGILDIVNKAGGYSRNAYPFGGVLENIQTREINEMASTKLYLSFLNNLTSQVSSNPDADNETLIALVQELRNTPPSGRVMAEFNLSTLEKDPSKDVILQDGDTLTIPEFLNQVFIFGEVASEGTVNYDASKSLDSYINDKGGYTEFSDRKAIYILHPNGQTLRYETRKNLFLKKKEDVNLYPGSVIFVPRKIESNSRQLLQAYTAIIGDIGVSLASLAVIKD